MKSYYMRPEELPEEERPAMPIEQRIERYEALALLWGGIEENHRALGNHVAAEAARMASEGMRREASEATRWRTAP